MIKIDAFGQVCPAPVLMLKKVVEDFKFKKEDIEIRVDNYPALKNIERLAKAYNAKFDYKVIDGGYAAIIKTSHLQGLILTNEPLADIIKMDSPTVYFITSDCVGTGNDELGATLMEMLINSIPRMEKEPRSICLMNSGVKLATENKETIKTLKKLEEAGVMVLVCGTCLEFYGLTKELKVGDISNAYEILMHMQGAAVIKL